MKIVIAPDSFRGSLTAVEVSDAIEQGIREVFSEANVLKVPEETLGKFVEEIFKDRGISVAYLLRY